MSTLGVNLSHFLLKNDVEPALISAIESISNACKIIASKVRVAGLADILGKAGKTNVQGEEVQKLDELANDILVEYLSESKVFYGLASEELDEPIFPEKGKEGEFVVSFDPLDGSSNIDVNVSIGTIFSIHRRVNGTVEDFLQEGYKQVAAGYVIYGPSTMLILSVGNGVVGFTLDPDTGMFLLSHPEIKMPEKGKIYSINEANAEKWDREGLREFIQTLKQEGYTLRYIGSMVADVHRTLIKGGIFAYPSDKKNKNGKLRLLYEAAPMAFLIEQAGGLATNGNENLLKVKPENIHQRTPVYLGSQKEIKQLLELLR